MWAVRVTTSVFRSAGEGLFGLVDDAADELAGGNQLVDRADALAAREELAVGVDGGAVGRPEVVDARLRGRDRLGGERLQLVGVLVEVLGPVVAHDPAGLAGVGAGDDGAVLGRADQGVLVALDRAGLRAWR